MADEASAVSLYDPSSGQGLAPMTGDFVLWTAVDAARVEALAARVELLTVGAAALLLLLLALAVVLAVWLAAGRVRRRRAERELYGRLAALEAAWGRRLTDRDRLAERWMDGIVPPRPDARTRPEDGHQPVAAADGRHGRRDPGDGGAKDWRWRSER